MHTDATFDPTDHLQHNGLKPTLLRRAILGVFWKRQQRQLKASDVFRQLAEQRFEVSMGTVNRVLADLARAGALRHVSLHAGTRVYEVPPRHPQTCRIVCTKSGAAVEFHDPAVEACLKHALERHGFASDDVSVTVYARRVAAKRAAAPTRK